MRCNFCKEGNENHASFLEVDREERVVNPVCGGHAHFPTRAEEIAGTPTRYRVFTIPFWGEKKEPTKIQLERHQEYLALSWNMPILNPQTFQLKFRSLGRGSLKIPSGRVS